MTKRNSQSSFTVTKNKNFLVWRSEKCLVVYERLTARSARSFRVAGVGTRVPTENSRVQCGEMSHMVALRYWGVASHSERLFGVSWSG